MWRYVAGGGAGLALIGAGVLALTRSDRGEALLPAAPAAAQASAASPGDDALPDRVPEASERTREEKRFDRYDKDRDAVITREEYLAQRRKAYARLDKDGDGRLSFDEWANKATTKFAAADRDRSGGMSRTEFATTAVKRRSPARAKCPPPAAEES